MTSSLPSYIYEPLEPGEDFRYLVLEPGDYEDPLRCSLHASRLDEAPYFEAISYVWGDPERDVQVTCGEHYIWVTPALGHVLRQIRLPDRARTLWSDSICIDQENLKEKGEQVACMGRIYRRSNRTLIVVAYHDEGHGAPAVALLDEVDKMITDKALEEWNSFPFLADSDPLIEDERWASVRRLFSMRWFSRGWCVQEAALAQEGVVIFGTYHIDWHKLMRVYVWLLKCAFRIILRYEIGVSRLHYSAFCRLHKEAVRVFMWPAAWEGVGKVLENIHCARLLGLADPRDRIYAFMQLPSANLSPELQLVPDYSRHFLDVYKDFALRYMRAYQDLDLLLYVSHEESSLESDFPSWIPRWDRDPGSQDIESSYAELSPLRDEDVSSKTPVIEDYRLQVDALVFGEVLFISDIFTREGTTAEGIAKLWSKVHSLAHIVHSRKTDRLNMFISSLSLGIMGLEGKKHHQNLAAFMLKIRGESGVGDASDDERWTAQAEGGDAAQYLEWIRLYSDKRRFVVTNRGYGMVPVTAREGDVCSIISGGKIPFVLRRTDAPGLFKLVGALYHSSDQKRTFQETGWDMEVGLGFGKDWLEWEVEGENIWLI